MITYSDSRKLVTARNLEWFHQQGGSPEYNKKVVMILNSLHHSSKITVIRLSVIQ